MTLQGKVALISGSGRGIGRAIALKLSRAGANVVLNDLDESVANVVFGTIKDAGGQAAICVGDVTQHDFGQRFVDTALDKFGGIDIIVNNAGYTWDNVLQKTQDEQWEAMLGVHLSAPFRILRAAQPVIASAAKAEMAKGQLPGRRSVVNIASIAGVGGNAGQVGYASAKAGIVGLTRTVAKEWGPLQCDGKCRGVWYHHDTAHRERSEQRDHSNTRPRHQGGHGRRAGVGPGDIDPAGPAGDGG